MDTRERHLRERFVEEHGITAEQFLSLVAPTDQQLMPDDDIGFVLAVHRASERNQTGSAHYDPRLTGSHHVALTKTQHMAFFFYHRMRPADRDALELLDGLNAPSGRLPVRHHYDNLYEVLMGLPTSEMVTP